MSRNIRLLTLYRARHWVGHRVGHRAGAVLLLAVLAAAFVSPNPSCRADDELLKQYLNQNVTPIDLLSALRLAGVQNSQILLAQQRVLEAVALRQLAAAQFLPTLNAG